MRFGSLFRSCPSRQARALRAPARVHVNGRNRLLLHAPGAAIATSISVHPRPSAALLFHAPDAALATGLQSSTVNFRLSPLRSQILSHLVLDPRATIALYFHNLTNSFSRKSFVLIFLQIARRVTPLFANSSPVNKLPLPRGAARPLLRRLAYTCNGATAARQHIRPAFNLQPPTSRMMTAPAKQSTLPANQGGSQSLGRNIGGRSEQGRSVSRARISRRVRAVLAARRKIGCGSAQHNGGPARERGHDAES